MVRARAGLKGVVESWKEYANNPDKPGSKEGLREIIHRERRIELSFEGQAGWDLRRWKELMDVLTDPVQGWDIYQEEAQSYYRPKTVFIPTFRTKDYLWPIRDQTLAENPNLVQRSEEHTSELQSLMRISYAVLCLKKNKQRKKIF